MDYDVSPDRRTMVVVTDGAAAGARAAATARDAGLSVVAAHALEAVGAVADPALKADLLLVEVDADPGAAYDAWLARVARLARGGQAAVVAIRPELIDATMAALDDAPVALLCAGQPSERLAIVEGALATGAVRLREDGPDRDAQLRAISGELARIADRLVAVVDPGLSPAGAGVPAVPPPGPDAPPVEARDYRRILRGRRLRDAYLGQGLFSDPAWDMLLDLAAARLERVPVAVSSLCIAAAVPPTTALRWIQSLTERGLLRRTPDPQDGRRVFVTLAPDTAAAMDAYVRAVRAQDAA